MIGVRSITIIAISLFTCYSWSGSAQVAVQNGVLDLRTEVRKVQQKSPSSYTDNTLALPLLEKGNKKKNQTLTWATEDKHQQATFLLSHNAESYVLLENVIIGPKELLVFTGADGKREIYKSSDNKQSGRLLAGPLRGDVTITSTKKTNPDFTVRQVYTDPNVEATELGFGAAFECQINVNCDAGRPYVDQKRGVMRIRMVAEEGVALCTGTLLNNTAEDGDPLVLTAYHCLYPASGELTPFFDMWYFDFNYEAFSCANPEQEPGVVALQGADVLAEWQETDMMLLRIQEPIPAQANAYYVGWDRRQDYLPAKTVLIHHPAGDIKKITSDVDPLQVFQDDIRWNNSTTTPAGSHFINDFDEAVYQPGSSGAGLLDDEGRVVGQLHGGPLSDEFCTIGIGYSGRLSESWNSGSDASERLSDWLDPIGTGAMRMNGASAGETEQIVQFKGKVVTTKGIAIPNVRVSLSGDKQASFLTGIDGRFLIDNLSTKEQYDIELTKETTPANGLSVIDLIAIQNHILGIRPINDEFSLRAADVNLDDRITSVDLVQMRNVMIGRTQKFSNSDSWRFEPGLFQMNGQNVGAGVIDVNIIGYKVGDVNGSANPRQ